MKNITAAIIGAGAIHGCHAAAIQQHAGATLRAIVDTDEARGRRLAQQYGCLWFADYRRMLADSQVDVVHICTPHACHRQMIIQALAAGKHVFSEKPVALNAGEVRQIMQALASATTRLGICYQNRFNPTSERMKALLAAGELGAMLSIKAQLTWSRNQQYYALSPWRGRLATEGGSLLINQAIHTLDLMQWFAGGVRQIKGMVDSSFLADATQAEDTAVANMVMTNGARGLFYATNCYTTDSPLMMEVHCERGLLQLQDNSLWLQVDGQRSLLCSDQLPDRAIKSYWGDSHRRAIEQFYQAIADPGIQVAVDLAQAEVSLQMVTAIYHSAQLRRWVSLTE